MRWLICVKQTLPLTVSDCPQTTACIEKLAASGVWSGSVRTRMPDGGSDDGLDHQPHRHVVPLGVFNSIRRSADGGAPGDGDPPV
jgi:hypothetical protein